MDWTTPICLLIALWLVVANGFFVLAEFALVKVRAIRAQSQQDVIDIIAAADPAATW